jgi:UDP-N-acetylmuramoyl-L-alanyl-D-glutamate--2,6-diaminopimelate ligase
VPLLSKLIADARIEATLHGEASVHLTSMVVDSRQVKPGSLFVAMPGVAADGTRYIPDALRAGASALMMAADAHSDIVATVPVIRASNMRRAVSQMAAAFYPEQPDFCFAITGTDGKTSTADFVRQLAQLSGMQAASMGTLGLRSMHPKLDAEFPANNTSPEPILLHQTLSVLCAAGVEVVALETSSHGLDQKRADGVRFAAAAFTNFTRDHLDYHGTMEAYFAAKLRLFSEVLGEGKLAVLNRDGVHFVALEAICKRRSISILSVGYHAEADYRILAVTPHAGGLDAQIVLHGQKFDLSLPLYGAFQLSNMLTAMGLLQAADMSAAKLVTYLPKLTGVPGRLEKIAEGNGAPIFIDYAHTPAALENILKTLRPHTAKKLHVVFGCGGDRDAGKRPEMGAIASQFADSVIVTDDNPRSEDATKIRAAILAAAPNAQEIPDRDTAIRAAIQQLTPGDVLVVAGKGHETTQTIGNQVLPFNDAEHIRKAIAA